MNVSERKSMPYHKQGTRTDCPPGRRLPRSLFVTTCGCSFVCCILRLARSSRCTTGQMLQPHNLYEYRVAVCRIINGRAVARCAWRQSVGNARLTAQYLGRTYTGCGQALNPVPQTTDAPMRREQSQAMKKSQESSETELTKREDRIGKPRT